MTTETDHFILYYNESDISLAEDLGSKLEEGYGKVTTDLQCTLDKKTVVRIYPETGAFHKAIGRPDAPSWYVGESTGHTISIAADMTNADPAKVVVHELTHAVTNRNFGNMPQWLFQGIAMYEAQETPLSKIRSYVHAGVIDNSIPTLKELDTEYWEFEEKGGYEFSYAAVDFIVNEFGFSKLNQFMTSGDYEKAFGLTYEELNGKYVEYLKSNYSKLL